MRMRLIHHRAAEQVIGAAFIAGHRDVPDRSNPQQRLDVRVVAVWNIPVACNECSADYLLSSPLMDQAHLHRIPDYASYLQGRA